MVSWPSVKSYLSVCRMRILLSTWQNSTDAAKDTKHNWQLPPTDLSVRTSTTIFSRLSFSRHWWKEDPFSVFPSMRHSTCSSFWWHRSLKSADNNRALNVFAACLNRFYCALWCPTRYVYRATMLCAYLVSGSFSLWRVLNHIINSMIRICQIWRKTSRKTEEIKALKMKDCMNAALLVCKNQGTSALWPFKWFSPHPFRGHGVSRVLTFALALLWLVDVLIPSHISLNNIYLYHTLLDLPSFSI